ncbi:MAG: hypothetical protein SVU88_00725 [Candidatus Nanohaloarchaea archaeon]|nr:hypothetical protein [Candidatus Nanohaloarchaea archaeon]
MDADRALVVVHPHRGFDHGVTEDYIVEAAEQFDGDVYFVPDTRPAAARKGELEGLYGEGVYDYLLTDETAGALGEETVRELEDAYEEVYVGGGYSDQCLRNAHRSLAEGTDLEVYVVPEISFGQQFRVTDGEEDTHRYRLADVYGDGERVQDHFQHFFGDEVGVATAVV